MDELSVGALYPSKFGARLAKASALLTTAYTERFK